MAPHDSDDLSVVIEQAGGEFFVCRSPETAEHDPNYERMAKFPTLEQAQRYLNMPLSQP
jgi:hypothetical protein